MWDFVSVIIGYSAAPEIDARKVCLTFTTGSREPPSPVLILPVKVPGLASQIKDPENRGKAEDSREVLHFSSFFFPAGSVAVLVMSYVKTKEPRGDPKVEGRAWGLHWSQRERSQEKLCAANSPFPSTPSTEHMSPPTNLSHTEGVLAGRAATRQGHSLLSFPSPNRSVWWGVRRKARPGVPAGL